MTFRTGDFVRYALARSEGFIIGPSLNSPPGMLVRVYRTGTGSVCSWLVENLELCPFDPTDQEVAAFTTHMLIEE